MRNNLFSKLKNSKLIGMINRAMEALTAFYRSKTVLFIGMFSVLLNFLLEILSRHSLIEALSFIISSPVAFVIGTAIIFATLLLSQLFPKHSFFLMLFSIVWLGFGITNCVILYLRVTPFSAIDLILLKSVIAIIGVYLKKWQLAVIAVAFALVGIGGVFLWKHALKTKPTIKKAIAVVITSVLLIALSSVVPLSAKITGNMVQDYDDLGFTYCFCSTIFDRGIERPADYSEKTVSDILDAVGREDTDKVTDDSPNIIFVQLESFMDMNEVDGLTMSENPTPAFSALKSRCIHGVLNVPVTGCGTANTEFEVLCQMNVSDFGTGEFPYSTVLQEDVAESIAAALSRAGYKTHALHNNTEGFYDRDIVFDNIGFDDFVSVEQMENVEYNSLGWAHDEILTGQIDKILTSTEEKDFIFTISVQAHGKYDDSFVPSDGDITAELDGNIYDEEFISSMLPQIEFYINQERGTDSFIAALTEYLKSIDEDTVLVLYGDHIPELGFKKENLAVNSLYKTEYVIWDSRYDEALNTKELYCEEGSALPAVGECEASEALYTYQLGAFALDYLGMKGGIMSRVYNILGNSDNYESDMVALEYYLLYDGGMSQLYPDYYEAKNEWLLKKSLAETK